MTKRPPFKPVLVALFLALQGCPVTGIPLVTFPSPAGTSQPSAVARTEMALATPAPQPTDCASEFADLDHDHDQAVDAQEYFWLAIDRGARPGVLPEAIMAEFGRRDVNHDGKLTWGEHCGAMPAPSATPSEPALVPVPTLATPDATPTPMPVPSPTPTPFTSPTPEPAAVGTPADRLKASPTATPSPTPDPGARPLSPTDDANKSPLGERTRAI